MRGGSVSGGSERRCGGCGCPFKPPKQPRTQPQSQPQTQPQTQAISSVSALRGGGESPLGLAGAPRKCASVGRMAPGSRTHAGTWAKFGFKYGTCRVLATRWGGLPACDGGAAAVRGLCSCRRRLRNSCAAQELVQQLRSGLCGDCAVATQRPCCSCANQ